MVFFDLSICDVMLNDCVLCLANSTYAHSRMYPWFGLDWPCNEALFLHVCIAQESVQFLPVTLPYKYTNNKVSQQLEHNTTNQSYALFISCHNTFSRLEV